MFKSIVEIELDTSEYNLTALNDVLQFRNSSRCTDIICNEKIQRELCSQVFIENTLFILAGL